MSDTLMGFIFGVFGGAVIGFLIAAVLSVDNIEPPCDGCPLKERDPVD